MNKTIIKQDTLEAIKLLSQNKELINGFILVGGTALSLHINHRESEDIDLFTEKEFLNKQRINSLIDKTVKDYSPIRDKENYLEFLINNIKVTFYSYGMPIENKSFINNLNIATIDEIAAMKAYTLGRRATFRDYYDLYCLMLNGYDLQRIIDLTKQRYGKKFNPGLFLKQLVYLDDIKQMSVINPKYKVDEKEILKFMTEKIRAYKEELNEEQSLKL
ncbi:MAG: hypothetical protein EVG15_07315 [Candidatus Acididesulfobacter diazotrophicus]|jgi:hypothetical protein|uniref:Nucleotidyl transferase AbiEii/AbiGii toxin family protein n=1 Tax=Candidatus Acididesulfobacter diazotrophicus TaxID=2597226 RepID=A0A519BLK4_9DELT|nr:MAG: hypothetical protein EVG15_07315 [Candidatus Acididesulfobacter diazotrophicus]